MKKAEVVSIEELRTFNVAVKHPLFADDVDPVGFQVTAATPEEAAEKAVRIAEGQARYEEQRWSLVGVGPKEVPHG